MEVGDLKEVLNEELENCIRKLRNAVYGYEVRTFITEYEELMLKKSDLVVQDFIKNDCKENREKLEIQRTEDDFNKSKITFLMVLQIVQGISIILLAMSLITQ